MHLGLGKIWQAIRSQRTEELDQRSDFTAASNSPRSPSEESGRDSLYFDELNIKTQFAGLTVHVPPRPQSPFNDSTLIPGTKTALGAGKVSTVYTYRFQTETGEVTKVFKAETKLIPENVIPVGASSIPNNKPQLCERAVASSKIDQLLGFDVLAETHLATVEGTQGIVMEYLVPNSSQTLLKPNDPILQKNLIALQLEDAIAGQVDRTAENYLIQIGQNEDVTGLKGIDNDFAFGKTAKGQSQPGCPATVNFPPIVDETQRNAIFRLKSGHLERALRESGLTDEQEIEAAKTRLLALKDHIQDNTKCTIIEPELWGSDEVTNALLSPPPRTSYFQRDIRQLSKSERPQSL